MIRCNGCDGKRVEHLEWIDPNKGEIIGGNDAWDDAAYSYCHDCKEGRGLHFRIDEIGGEAQ